MAQPNRRIGERDGGVRAPERAAFSEFLLAARRGAGLSIDEIATMTKVPARHLDALEHGRIEDLPRGVYRRGILRTYASAVGLEPSLVLERFSQAFGTDAAFSEWEVVPASTRVRTLPAVRTPSVAIAAEPVTVVSPRRSVPTALPQPVNTTHRKLVAIASTLLLLLVAAYMLTRPDRSMPVVIEAPGLQTPPAASVPAAAGVASGPDRLSSESVDVTLPPQPDARTSDAASPLAAEPPAAPRQTEPQLIVTSNPAGARVTVDGVGWGVTPITIRYLPPGVKRIRVTLDGYVGQEREVRIGDDGGAVSTRITLEPRD